MAIHTLIYNGLDEELDIVRTDGSADIVIRVRVHVPYTDEFVTTSFTITELERLQMPVTLNLGLDRSKW